MTHKLYELLGVPQSSSKDDIKKAYKKLAVQMHPDKGGDPEKFKEISHAYSVLSDDEKRRQYDQLGDDGFENGVPQHMDPNDIFAQFFGNMGGFPFGFNVDVGPQKKSNHVHELNISLEDAFKGMHKVVKVNMTKMCKGCKEMCHMCQGKGHVMDMRRMGFLTQMMQRPCDACKTSGYIAKGKTSCSDCKGTGALKEEHKLEINIPAGVDTGHHVAFKGLGEQANSPHEVPGDLIFRIHVQQHHAFRRQGADLIYTTKITLVESICGKDITIPHFAGDIHMNISEFGVIQPNKPYIVKGKGMPNGNLLILFEITYPSKKLSREECSSVRDALNKVLS